MAIFGELQDESKRQKEQLEGNIEKKKTKKRTPKAYGSTVRRSQGGGTEMEVIGRSNTDTTTDLATSILQGKKMKTTKRNRLRYPFEYYEDELNEFMGLKDRIREATGEDVSYSRMAREAMKEYTQKINKVLDSLINNS